MRTALLTLCTVCLVARSGDFACAAAPRSETVSHFKVTIGSKLKTDSEGETEDIDASTEISYTWQAQARQRSLSFDSILVQASVDGKEVMNTFMDRTRVSTPDTDKTKPGPKDSAPDHLKTALENSFGVPIFVIELDDARKFIRRTRLIDPDAKPVFDQALIANALLFHPEFPDKQETWQSPAGVHMGNNALAKGKLTYVKVPGNSSRPTTRVSGTLVNAAVTSADGQTTIKNAQYVVGGQQTYDMARHEWISGKLSIDVTYQLFEEDREVAKTAGKMVLTLELVNSDTVNELPAPPDAK